MVRDPRDGSWAAFSDCLITSPEVERAPSLRTPIRGNAPRKDTFGFAETAIEEKLGFLEDGTLFGWCGNRADALVMVDKVRSKGSYDELAEFCRNSKNGYLIVSFGSKGRFNVKFIGGVGQLTKYVVNGFEFLYAGSGSKIMNGLRFNAHAQPPGQGAPDVVFAALSAMGIFLTEEMTSHSNQFYSLATGGHYRIFYGTSSGARHLRFSVTHWDGTADDPRVKIISLPLDKDGHEIFASLEIESDWQAKISSAIKIAPLLQSPRRTNSVNINLLDVLRANIDIASIHVCWRPDGPRSLIVNRRESPFEVIGDQYRPVGYSAETLENVRQQLYD